MQLGQAKGESQQKQTRDLQPVSGGSDRGHEHLNSKDVMYLSHLTLRRG